MFRFVAIMSFFVVISGNSMTGNFQTCQLQCNNDESGGTYEHPITNSPPNSGLLRGKSGPKGEKGSRGDVGKKGDPGVSGVKGDPGVSGVKGDPGVSGVKGDRGVSGVKGDRGVSGMKGDRGVSGVKGDPGVSCNLEEISEMKGKMAQMESDLESTRKVVKILSKDLNKWEICGVGIQDPNVIPDDRMTASTYHSDRYVPHNGRLLSTVGVGAWGPVRNDKKTGWLQVDLGSQSRIYGIVTQGAHQNGYNEWVTTYQVSYQRNSEGFKYITDQSGRVMVFQGNTDKNTPVQNTFPAPISARYFRVHLKSYTGYPLLRFELLTC